MTYFMLMILHSYRDLNIFQVQKINKLSESNLAKYTECCKNASTAY